MISLFRPEEKSPAEKQFASLYESLVSTPALKDVTERSWTMSTEPIEQTVEATADGIRFSMGEFAFSLTSQMSKIFEDENGLCGYGRLLETMNSGASVSEWIWDAGITFPPHFHDWAEILTFVTGTWRMCIDGKWSVFGPESTVRIPAGVIHSGIGLTKTTLIAVSIPELG